MDEVTTTIAAIYLLVGMFALIGSGTLEALTSGWIDTIHGKHWDLRISVGLLYLLAIAQITVFWAFWPVVLWHAWSTESRREERRRIP